MAKFIFLLIFFLYSVATASTNSDPYKDIKYYKLENGMQVYLLSDKKAVNTNILLTVRVGFDVENDNTNGLSHLVEHMVFRDQRVPHHDYLDYIQDEGGTYVNGYTKRYETGYLTTIDSNKSYWITKTFATMLFDKNVTNDDLTVERGALQTEVGESHWYFKPLWYIGTFFKIILAPKEDFYYDEFGLSKEKILPANYHAQENNKKFTFDNVMTHYHSYYYPANMTLRIVGNFSIEKMKKIIAESYGRVKREGTKHTTKPSRDAHLNGKEYRRFYEGVRKNSAYIGAKYLLNDYKKYLIMNIYTDNLSKRVQQQIRNKLGKTYSVNPYYFSERNAGVVTLNFDSLHNNFEDNIKRVERIIQVDVRDINESTIADALRDYDKQYYKSVEHDSDSLKYLVATAKYLREDLNITDKTSYEIFSSITPQEFRETIQQIFTPQNSYKLIYRDYYFFPMDTIMLNLLFTLVLIFIYIKVYQIGMKKEQILYTHRDVVIHRRVSNRFIGFLHLLITLTLATIVTDWILYLFLQLFTSDPYYQTSIDVPYSYIVTIAYNLFYIFIFALVYYYLWRYYARLEVTKEALIFIGNRVKVFKKEDITIISTAEWSMKNHKKTLGVALLFWYDVTKIEMKDGTSYYLRASNAAHLSEDLNKWLET